MAIKGSFNYKGIIIPEAYVRITNIFSKHKQKTLCFQIIVYVSEELANNMDAINYQLAYDIFTDTLLYDYSVPIQTAAYNFLKTLDRFKDWEDC